MLTIIKKALNIQFFHRVKSDDLLFIETPSEKSSATLYQKEIEDLHPELSIWHAIANISVIAPIFGFIFAAFLYKIGSSGAEIINSIHRTPKIVFMAGEVQGAVDSGHLSKINQTNTGLSLLTSTETLRDYAMVMRQSNQVIESKIKSITEDLDAPPRSSLPSEKIIKENSIKIAQAELPAFSVIDLQPFQDKTAIELQGTNNNSGSATLYNLNPNINIWYILKILWPNSKEIDYFHLENPFPDKQRFYLHQDFLEGLIIKSDTNPDPCPLWSKSGFQIKMARYTEKPYASICQGRLFLRNKIDGHQTTKEWVVDFLRSNVYGGEKITTIVKNTIYKDSFLISAEPVSSTGSTTEKEVTEAGSKDGPANALIDPKFENNFLEAKDLGIDLESDFDEKLVAGKWYHVKKQKAVYLSVIQPKLILESMFDTYKDRVSRLDNVENSAISYLVGFDLSKTEIDFALGTDHPSVEWSDRVNDKLKDKSLPGPDGIGEIFPIIPLGLVNPIDTAKIVATFTGGFKRSHGAFKWGDLGQRNFGSHYGFIENGVILSKLQPGLATILIFKDGSVDMKTWTTNDEVLLPKIKHARQNGVAVIDFDQTLGKSFPGDYVDQWGPGNWSGSQDSKFRTLRAGICLQKRPGQNFLLYGYFSSASPSAMARVFQSYSCQYAFHLDMNALEHTYLAIYSKNEDQIITPEHLITGMSVLDKNFKGQEIPRFIGYPDNRDFFYVISKD